MEYNMNMLEKINQNYIINTDLIIPIGTQCISAYFLKENSLRMFSMPFDWMDTRKVKLNDFLIYFEDFNNNFFNTNNIKNNGIAGKFWRRNLKNKDDLEEIYVETLSIVDTKTNMNCVHFFESNINSVEDYNENVFLPMMRKRFNKMIECIEQSNTIMFVSFFRKNENNCFKTFLEKMNELYNKNYIFLNINYSKKFSLNKLSFSNHKYTIYDLRCNFCNSVENWDTKNYKAMRKYYLSRIVNRIKISNKINYKLYQ